MQYLTLAAAIAGLVAPSMATPVPEFDLETRGSSQYTWSVTKRSFSRGNNEYDYSFDVHGSKDAATPGFTASCKGISKGGYRPCTVTAHQGEYTPSVSANVNIVVDPNDPDDSIPRLFVHMQYTDNNECTYFWDGKHDATLNSGSYQGSKFTIVPNPSAVC